MVLHFSYVLDAPQIKSIPEPNLPTIRFLTMFPSNAYALRQSLAPDQLSLGVSSSFLNTFMVPFLMPPPLLTNLNQPPISSPELLRPGKLSFPLLMPRDMSELTI